MKKYLWIFLISMVPLIELRGAIPVAVGLGLPIVPSIIISVVGNMLPVPFIFLFARRVLEWGKDKKVIGGFFTWCLEKGEKGGRKLEAKAGRGLYWALLLFVGIPIPGTGAWTGTLAASILNMDFKKSVLFVLLGVLLAGAIMLAASLGVFGEEDGGAHGDVEAVQAAQHGDADVGGCRLAPQGSEAGGFRTHHQRRAALHVHVVVQ